MFLWLSKKSDAATSEYTKGLIEELQKNDVIVLGYNKPLFIIPYNNLYVGYVDEENDKDASELAQSIINSLNKDFDNFSEEIINNGGGFVMSALNNRASEDELSTFSQGLIQTLELCC